MSNKTDRDQARIILGEELKNLRENTGKLVREIAAGIGVGEVTVIKRENGTVGVHAEELIFYERFFRLSSGTIIRRVAGRLALSPHMKEVKA